MSEYMEKHSVSKLICSPPGYVGYEEAGQLTEKVRRNPYSLILLDEIEKAHPDVLHMFLQIGFGAAREGVTRSVLNQLNNYFTPEFLNRFDGIIEFKALSKENLLSIVSLMLADVNQTLANQKLHIEVPENVQEKLVELGYSATMGARPLRRTIQDHIEDGIAEFYLDHPQVHDLQATLDSEDKIIVTAKTVDTPEEPKEQEKQPSDDE